MRTASGFLPGAVSGFLLLLGLEAAAFYLNLGVPIGGISDWTFQLTQRKARLAAQAPSPRLLLVGGSATLFGISARELQKETGWRTINLATHAALGPACLLHQAQRVARPGDTVLLVFEYEMYAWGKVGRAWADSLFIDYIVSRDPDFFHSLPWLEQWNVFMLTSNKRLLNGLKSRWGPERPQASNGVYSVSFLNEWGDQTHHTKGARPPGTNVSKLGETALGYGLPPQPGAFPIIASFCQWAKTNHIRVLATFPNISDHPDYHLPVARQTADRIKDFFSTLDVPVVGEFEQAILPPNQFFDTVYHPTEEAALARTERLAGRLKSYLR